MKEKWFKKAVGYQIYPRSFKDSNGDGVGDINGIIEKLPYLKDLGIDFIWICPIYQSPMDDNGYDISDFLAIDKSFGNLLDFKNLIKKAHDLGIKIIVDLVLNHSSDEHLWFQKAISSKDNEYQEYYYFKEGRYENDVRKPPTNWQSFFSQSAWTYVESIDKYYLHIFSKKMPDLNWTNPKLRNEMKKIARYYLELGCDGFRLDAIAHLSKDNTFTNINDLELAFDSGKFSNREELFDYLKELKTEVFDKYECFTVGEVGGCASEQEGLRYSNYQSGFLDMVFNFDTCWQNGAYGSIDKKDSEIVTDVYNLKTNFKRWFDAFYQKGWQPVYWLNHDHPRVLSQYGDLNYHYESGSMLGMVLLFMPATPFIYQGEEIGMSNVNYKDISDFDDISAKNFYDAHKDNYSKEWIVHILNRCSRDNARSIMQWNDSFNAGFSSTLKKLKINDNYKEINVSKQENETKSILKSYKQFIKYRKEFIDFIITNKIEFIDLDNQDIFAYQIKPLTIIGNFRNFEVDFDFDLDGYEVLYNNYEILKYQNNKINLAPFQALLLKK